MAENCGLALASDFPKNGSTLKPEREIELQGELQNG